MILPDPVRTALVTGGARRIGRVISERLVAEGYAVALHYQTSVQEAEELSKNLREKGARIHLLRGDLANPADVDRLVPEANTALGSVSLLVNNASTFEADEIQSLTRTSFSRHIRINLETPLVLAQAFARAGTEGIIDRQYP